MAKKEELATVEATQVSEYRAPDVADLMKLAVEKNISVEGIEKLVSLNERLADRAARQEFNRALQLFSEDCPPIKHNVSVSFASRGGGKTAYSYADLDQITKIARPIAFKHGLSWTFDSETTKDTIKTVCILRHEAGHEVRSSFEVPTESKSSMGPQQRISAAQMTGRRKSLEQALGLTTTEKDIDYNFPNNEEAMVGPNQVKKLSALAKEVNADVDRLLAYFEVAEYGEMTVTQFKKAMMMLDSKR